MPEAVFTMFEHAKRIDAHYGPRFLLFRTKPIFTSTIYTPLGILSQTEHCIPRLGQV